MHQTSVEFDATLTPLTLVAGQTYTFAFYAESGAPPPARLLHVTNALTNSVTTYALPVQGNALPVRTIAGGRTGLNTPYSLAVDADGNIVVANALANTTASIEIFATGADRNASPVRTFSTPNFPVTGATPVKLALDPFSADLDVALATDVSRITTFSPLGIPLRSLSSDAFNVMFAGGTSPAAVWAGLNVDEQGRLVVGYTYADRFSSAGDVAVRTNSFSHQRTRAAQIKWYSWVGRHSTRRQTRRRCRSSERLVQRVRGILLMR